MTVAERIRISLDSLAVASDAHGHLSIWASHGDEILSVFGAVASP